MKIFVGLFGILLAASSASAGDYCYKDVSDSCGIAGTASSESGACSALYGGIQELLPKLQSYVNTNIMTSFDYLLMSTHFGSYATNREGFKGLYRKLSDKTWNDAIDLIKFITQRGGAMNFEQPAIEGVEDKTPSSPATNSTSSRSPSLDEIKSLARALDMHKELAKGALSLYAEAHTKSAPKSDKSNKLNKLDCSGGRDGSVAHYIEEKFMEEHAETVRKLAGYANDMKSFVSKYDAFTVFMFDEYLKSTL